MRAVRTMLDGMGTCAHSPQHATISRHLFWRLRKELECETIIVHHPNGYLQPFHLQTIANLIIPVSGIEKR